MFSLRSLLCASLVAMSLSILAQSGSIPTDPFHVHHKHVSAQQGVEHHFGAAVAMGGDVLVVADETEVVEVLRRNADGTWALEATIAPPATGIDFGSQHALATNGEWIAIGAQGDDTFGTNAGAVYMYKFDGLDWQYEGALSHMAPNGSIGYDSFGKGVAMDGDRMVVGSSAENGEGANGAIHYFQYHAWLDMWLESGFIASTHTTGASATRFASVLDISGDWLIAGEYGNPDAGTLAGAAHIYWFHNQCWHHHTTFFGHAAQDRLGTDVSISGDRAVAGSPMAGLNGLSQSGAVTVYERTTVGNTHTWSEMMHFIPDAVVNWDRFGSALDLDGNLLAVGAPQDDQNGQNAGLGYFLFDCDSGFECVAEGSACDAQPQDRFGFDVATSGGLAAIGAMQDDNIFEDAGSVYVLGADDLGFACDLTPPGAPEVDLIDANDTGVSAEDDTTRHTTPDFDVLLPGGGTLSVMNGYTAQAGDALVFYMVGSGDSTLVILTEDDIQNGVYTFEFVYPGPVLEDGVYTFCAYLIDAFGNVGETDCQTILIDNDDPEIDLNFSGGALAGSDTTLYLDDDGNAVLDLLGGNITTTDNIGIDTVYFDITDFDCDDAGLVTTVTATVIDIAGNIITTTFNVAVIEIEAPFILTQDITVYLDASGAASITTADVDNGSYDDCSGLDSLSLDITDVDCDDLAAAVTVTLTGVDLAGNSGSATASVTVLDTLAPAIADTPADITLSNDAGLCSAVAIWLGSGTEPTASDNCTVASFTSSHNSGDAFPVGSTTVTLTATDQSGNTASTSFTVTVTDTESPSISGTPADITQGNDAGNCSAAVSWTGATASDNCAVSTLTSSHNSGDTFPVGTTTVTYTATDIHGNTTTSTFNVTVTDSEAPAISGTPADITQTADAGNCSAAVSWTAPTASDNCALANLTADATSGDTFAVGTTTVTYTATDIYGNSSTSSFDITVTDDEAPTISGMPADITQANDAGNCSAVVSWTAPTAADNCAIASLMPDAASGSTFAVGTTTVTYTATDIHGNTTTASFTVTVTDTEAPTLSGTPADITQSNDAGNCSAAVSWTAPTASDNCASPTVTSTHNPGDTFPVGTSTVTYTATDAAGNSITSSFNVTVTDDENPAINGLPADITQTNDAGNCSAAVSWTAPTASDNCAVSSLNSTHSSGDTFPVGTTTVSYTATDIHGNTTTSTFNVTVTDDEAPAISGTPADITQNSDAGVCTAAVSWTAPTAADNCSLASLTSDIASGSTFSGGTTTVTYTATDIYGNSSTSSFTVTVVDAEAPAISGAPADITQSNDAGNCSAAVTWSVPSASDNCAAPTLTSTHNPGDAFPVGTTTVTYTALDGDGNSITASFNVTVTDDEDPAISGTPADITQTNDAGSCSAAVSWTAATASDNCAVSTLTSSHNSGDTFPVGTTTVTYTATDIHGNTTSSTFNVTVTDDEAPAISGTPADITQTADAGNCSAAVSWTAPTATDNCALANLTADAASGDTFAVGTTTVTYTATDIYGNSSTSSFNVTVTDDEAPSISGTPSDITQTNDAGNCSAAVSWTAPTASDNCAVSTLTSSHASGDTFAVGTTTVTYTATDIHGNSSTSSFNVTVTDDENPAISGTPGDITQTNDAGSCSAVVSWTAPTASDNCAVATLTSSHTSGDAFPVGTTTVTYTATDIHGNSSSSSFNVTVTDDENPAISGTPADITQTNDAGNCSAAVSWTAPTASDNCAVSTLTSSHDSGDTFPVGTTTVSYTATDIHGNTTTSTFTVTVTDDEDPAISGMPADITQSNDAGECSADVTWTEPTASDNCAVATFTADAAQGDTFAVGTTTVTYTATDIYGNSSTGSFTVTVVDTEAPTISGTPADITVDNAAGNCSATVTWAAPTPADNCGVTGWTSSHNSGDSFPVGTTTVTYTATDAVGNSASSSFNVTVSDDNNPLITTAAADSTYQRDGDEDLAFAAWLASNGGATASDNCGIDYWSNDSQGLSDGCGSTGSETVTFTVTDIHGNSSTTSATFTVIDDFAPSCPTIDLTDDSDTGLSNSDNITNDHTPTMRVLFTGSGVESAEAGDIVELYINSTLAETRTIDQTDVDNGYAQFETGAFPDGPVIFAARHIDDCGQASIFAFLNIIIHSTDPTAVADDITLYLDGSGNVILDPALLDGGSSDDYNALDFTASQTAFDCSDLGGNAVTLTVTDIAGNTDTEPVTVTVVDNTAPAIAPIDITVQLDASGAATIALGDVSSITDNCSVASSSIDITSVGCADVGTVTVTITATDQSGNTATATATVTVEDNVPPTVLLIDTVLYLDSDGLATLAGGDLDAGSSDACGIAGFAIGVPGTEAPAGQMLLNVPMPTLFIPEYTFDCDDTGSNLMFVEVEDVNGNLAYGMVNIAVYDTSAPVVHIFDLEDYTLYAGETCVNEVDLFAAGQPWYEADDNCDQDVEILYDIVNETGTAGCREFDRRWIIQSTDASGNMGSDTTLQHITVMDATAPMVFFDNAPEDLTLELDDNCEVDIPEAGTIDMTASATDNCTAMPALSAITYLESAPEALCDGGGSYTITRTFTATATDDCGNETVGTHVQTITVLDVTAPQITNSGGISNGETLTETEAGGIFDFIELPEAIELAAEDVCSDVTIELVESESGFVPTEDIGNYCGAATPAAFSGGEACNGHAPAAIILEGAPFNGEAFTITPGGINIVESYYDQTLRIEIEVTNADGTGGFIWNADYNEALNWNQWNALGRGYKKDCANVLPGQSPWTNWQYFVMQTGGMLGTGIYAGSELSLTHQPFNYYYGLQVGNGANNQNANYGASAWFYWSGQLIVDGVSQGFLGSSGDISLDLDCVMPWAMDFSYSVTDACGNETLFSYGVTNAAAQSGGASASGETGHQPFDISVAGDVKEPIRITGLMPNPTNNVSQLGFVVSNNMRLRVDLYDMGGQLIQELFDGNAMSDVEYFLTIDAQGLDAGMYQIRISSNTYMAVKKLLVSQ